MKLLRPLIIAFSVYSRLPMPNVAWNEHDNRLALAFLPLVGCIVACCFFAIQALSMGWSPLLRGALSLAAVVLVTGGIHMDGFLDTCDAISSLKEKDERLAILKDVHVGAFAVIRGLVYALLMMALYAECDRPAAMAMGFVLSRCGALVLLCTLPNARKGGMLYAFQENLMKRAVLASAAVFAVLASIGALVSAFPAALVAIALLTAFAAYFHGKAHKLFGGMTGDLAGYALQMMELCWALGIVLGGKWL